MWVLGLAPTFQVAEFLPSQQLKRPKYGKLPRVTSEGGGGFGIRTG